jgi:hypothetical protein
MASWKKWRTPMAKTSDNLREWPEDILFMTFDFYDDHLDIGTNFTALNEIADEGRVLRLSNEETIRLYQFLKSYVEDAV